MNAREYRIEHSRARVLLALLANERRGRTGLTVGVGTKHGWASRIIDAFQRDGLVGADKRVTHFGARVLWRHLYDESQRPGMGRARDYLGTLAIFVQVERDRLQREQVKP